MMTDGLEAGTGGGGLPSCWTGRCLPVVEGAAPAGRDFVLGGRPGHLTARRWPWPGQTGRWTPDHPWRRPGPGTPT